MPNETPAPNTLDAIIADYLHAVESGEAPDPEAIKRANPQHAAELDAFFANHAGFQNMVEPLHPTVPATVTGDDSQATVKGETKPLPLAPKKKQTWPDFPGYDILGEIAPGGMGMVYKARQKDLNRTVALKTILAKYTADQHAVVRFKIEAEAAASLDHPNIVPIYDIGEHDGKHYFSMKFVEGTSLSKKIPELVKNPRAAATLMVTVSRAIHFAHQRGILHRDLKPGNILLDAKGDPHVTDFGLAKKVEKTEGDESLTAPGGIVGTPAYMSPEQGSGEAKRLTTATDIYSLGAILYELLTGSVPFKADDYVSLLIKARTEEPPPPITLNPKVNRDLATIALKCLEKDPAKRYASADALADELERWLRGESIQARRASAFEKLVRWERRNPGLAWLTTAIFLILLVGIVVSMSFAIEAERQANEAAAALKEQRRLSFEAVYRNAEADDALGQSAGVIAPLERYLYEEELAQHPMRAKAEKLVEKAKDGYKRFAAFAKLLKARPKSVSLDLGIGVMLELILIPKGSFVMGGKNNDEFQHPVEITKPFYMSKFPVTQEQYQTIAGSNPSVFKGRPKNPVESVNWFEAVAFCEKLNKQSGPAKMTFALPTEAQWEYACRAGTTTEYNFGDDEKELGKYAWFGNNIGYVRDNIGTQPVGGKPANPFGLFDMHGNVFQLCADWYDENYFKNSPKSDPTGPKVGVIEKRILKTVVRSTRGGSWRSSEEACRAAFRQPIAPGDRDITTGFRVVLLLDE